MFKRGQITIFIILGILVFGVIITAIYLNSEKTKASMETKEDLIDLGLPNGAIKSYVESCIKNTAKEGILENGRKGGYFLPPPPSTTDFYENVPYFLENGTVLFPSNQVLAEEIASHVDALLVLCLNNFESFKSGGYNITFEEPSSIVTINGKKLFLQTQMPIIIKKSYTVTEISSFNIELPAPQLYENWKALRDVLTSSKKGKLCLTCLTKKAEKMNWVIQAMPLGTSAQILDITDRDYLIGTENYHMKFAVRYGQEE